MLADIIVIAILVVIVALVIRTIIKSGDAGFAKCNGAGGVIKQQREIIFTRAD